MLLLAEPLDAALAQVWSARVQRGAAVRWRGFVQRWAGRRDLPPSADLPALARLWAERVGPEPGARRRRRPAARTGPAAEVLGLPLRPGTDRRRRPAGGTCRPPRSTLARRVNGGARRADAPADAGTRWSAAWSRRWTSALRVAPARGLTVPASTATGAPTVPSR